MLTKVAAPAKKRILLVATDDVRRDLRARVMRKMGVEVDCAADICEARSLWRADSYNLVLLDIVHDARNVEEFCCEVKAAKPPQAVGFLVGKPEYIAASPTHEEVGVSGDSNGHANWGEVVASLFASACEGLPRRWGFQEAAWRIAAARSLKDPSRNHDHKNAGRRSWADAVAHHSKSAPIAAAVAVAGVPPPSIPAPEALAVPDLHLERTR